jgi:hypothetical protein
MVVMSSFARSAATAEAVQAVVPAVPTRVLAMAARARAGVARVLSRALWSRTISKSVRRTSPWLSWSNGNIVGLL